MAWTVADVVSRARGFATSNHAALTSDPAEMIARVSACEIEVFAEAARASRYFHASASLTSSNAASDRTATFADANVVERIIRVRLASGGTEVRRVDLHDTDAEVAPRYFTLGTTLHEVGSDWGASGAIGLTVDYAKAPAILTISGATTQSLTLPDKYADVLAIRLAAYLAAKDTGARAADEVARLDALYRARLDQVLSSLDSFGGYAYRRFLPVDQYPAGSQ